MEIHSIPDPVRTTFRHFGVRNSYSQLLRFSVNAFRILCHRSDGATIILKEQGPPASNPGGILGSRQRNASGGTLSMILSLGQLQM
ncbi:MAG: hypothetical protein CL912_00910 [Deltaproteobacteria bacterium]|nr:hypothetical protein [Deltaproteobacteria bacterium]